MNGSLFLDEDREVRISKKNKERRSGKPRHQGNGKEVSRHVRTKATILSDKRRQKMTMPDVLLTCHESSSNVMTMSKTLVLAST